MKRLLALSATCASIFALASPAGAQFDHMSCFKVKDPAKFSALVTLDALQDDFDPTGQCQLKRKAKLYCVPTDKQVDELDPGSPLGIPGQELTSDMLCYKVKCPKETIAESEVIDQFGERTVSKFKRQLLCTPAYQTRPSCEPPDPPQCVSNDCTTGTCSTTGRACNSQGDCPIAPREQCCCNGICL